MKRILLFIPIFLLTFKSLSQPITVNNTTYTVPQLVQDVLFASGSVGSSCVGTISNITWSTGSGASDGSSFGSSNGIGYFQNTNPNFPLTSGVILSTGNAMSAPGPNTSTLGEGSNAWPGDNDLFNYINNLGIDPGLTDYNNATVLEFDFTPLTNQMSFDFLFASEEYGTFQCAYSDSFAFFLTNVTAGTPTTNLALLPSTNTPISVVTIRDNANNANCASANPSYFGIYNGGANAANSATNFNGETVLMTANATVIPNNVYHIKLVIADRNDNSYDSAVFLGGGSFDIGTASLAGIDEFDGLDDFTGPNAICGSETLTIQAGETTILGATYEWTLEGNPIVGANSFTHTITQEGNYCVTITYPSGCQQTDCLEVEYIPSLPIGTPNDLFVCVPPFNLNDNTNIIMNGLSNTVTYHHSLFDAQQLASPITNPLTYNGLDGEVIYAALEDDMTGCITTTQFTLHIAPALCADPIPFTPPNLTLCESSFGSGTAIFDFIPQIAEALGSTYSPADYTVTFHLNQNDADLDQAAISPMNSFVGTNGQTIIVRLEENADSTHFGTTSFQLFVNPLPVATVSGSTAICSSTTTTITFNGSPNAVVTYNIDGNPNQTITLNASGTGSVVTPVLVAPSTYNLVSVLNPTTNCSQLLSGSATVTINSLPTATISGTTSICSGTTAVISFNGTPNAVVTYSIDSNPSQTVTLNAAGNASVTTPVLTTSSTYTLISVQNPTTGCSQSQTGSAVITVNPLPIVTISGTATICFGDTVTITFNGTPNAVVAYNIDSNPNQTITLNGSGNAVLTSGPLSSSTVYNLVSATNPSTGCSQLQTGSAVITVNTAPVINTPTDYVVCDDSYNNDGFYCNFDLNSIINQVSGGNPNIVVTFHETLTNSQTGANPLVSPYCNIDPGLQTIYVRAYFNGSPACYSNTTFNLIINPLPLANPVITDYELCDYNNPGDGVEVFTLDTKDVEIANGQSNVTIEYYLTQADAEAQTSPLPNLYTNISNPQEIWINISNNTTGCSSVSSFNLVVNPLPLATTPEPIFQCSNGATTQALFDLTINEGVVIAGNTSLVSVTYYNTLVDAQNEASPIGTPSTYTGTDNEIVYIRVEDNITGCYSTTTQLLRVTQGPVAITPQALHYCDPNNDGFGVFDLESATTQIAGGVWPLTGVSISYYETETDALIGAVPSLTSPYENINPWTQTIYVRVFYTLTGCANYVQLQLIVDPTPEATEPDDYELCDYTGQIGFESFDLTTTVPQILGAIDPATVTVTFHTTLTNAQDDANAIGGVTNYINQTQWNQTLYVRVEFNTTGCYDIVELDLIVNPLPNATQPNYPQYTLCDYNGAIGFETFDLASQVAPILLNQTGMTVTFYPSLTDAQNDANAINVSHPDLQYPNQIIYVQTLGIRITNTTTGCYSISTIDIRVSPLPTPIPPTETFTICDDNQDGFASFDLLTLTSDILQGAPYILTFHETLTDAQQGNTPIDTSVLYDNINPFFQILYVRAVDPLTGCWSVIAIELNVNPSPIAPIDLDDIVVCDEDNNTQNAITIVDLTQRTPDVLAQQPLAPSNYVVEYYTSETAAQDGIAPIINAASYTAMNNQTIWVRVENTTTGCYNIGSFDIIINIPLLLTTPAPLSVCDDDANPNDQYHSFDLTVKDAEITQNLTGYTVTYYPSLALAQAGGASTITDFTAYTNITPAVQTLGVVVTSAAGCQSITTLDIRVLPIPTPNTNPNPLAPLCDDNNPGDMLEVFDLTVNAAYITNGDPNVTLTYYTSEADALVPQFPIADPTQALVGGNVWIRVENNRVDYLGNRCFVLVEQALTVNPLPEVIQPLAPYRMCDDNTDGIAQFDLTNPDLAIAILGANQSPADFTITYYLTAAGANPFTNTGETPLVSPYTNVTPDTQDIYIRVVNNATGCVNATGVLTLAVEEYATATGPQVFSSCDDYLDPYDGVFQLDLTQFNAAILGTQDPLIFIISYYHSQADAEAGINAIPLAEAQAYITAADTDQIWVKVENSSNSIVPFCYALTTIDIEIERYPNPIIVTPNNVNTICVDFTSGVVVRPLTLDSGIPNPADYTFEWYEDGTLIAGATASTYTVDTSSATGATRNYHVRVISNSPLLCETTSADFPVIQSGQAVAAAGTFGYTVTNAFTDSQIITVTVEGWGTYEYSLDDGPRQASNIFEGVSLGNHTIHVWDTEGGVAFSCEELTIEDVMVIDYPHYFTPNGDGFHDTWNIVGLNRQPNAKIYIFDRYGKLLKQISSDGEGWDGTYNGKLLPSDDYWFSVDYSEETTAKQFKAHFSLKR